MTKKAKRPAPRFSGKLTAKMLVDLCQRLQEQVNIAEAIEAAARPHPDVIAAAYPMLKVLELAAACHAAALRQASDYAKIISEGRPA